MQALLRSSALFLVFFVFPNFEVRAADAPPAKSGSAMKDFKEIQGKFNEVNAELQILQVEYRKSKKEDRPTLEKKWKEQYQKAEELQPKFFQAAEKAYAESPNADKELTSLLGYIFNHHINSDAYEDAARVAKLLTASGKLTARGYAMAGVAAVATNDFKSAAVYFDKAKAAGAFKEQPKEKDTLIQNAMSFSANLAALEKNWKQEEKIREDEAKSNDLPRVLIKTEKGDIVVELFENEAPNTVANFLSLVEKKVGEKKFYDGVTFHRVLPGFMAQGGDPQGDGMGGPGYTIPDEVATPKHRKHFCGSLSMAKSMQPNSGGSQFFLCFLPTPQLDGKHTVFGRVIGGLDVLAKIQRRDPEDPNAPDPDKIIEMKVERPPKHELKLKKTGE